MANYAPSKVHNNRRLHNWLAYSNVDKYLLNNIQNYVGTLYDLGSGTSPYKEFFLNYVDQYIAVDWSSSLHNTDTDIEANLNQPLPIDSDVADTIVSLSVLEHLCEPQIMLNEAFRILKCNGKIILQVPWQWWVHEAPYDYYRYTPYGLRHMFEKAGFADITVESQAGFFTTIILKLNYFTLRFVRGPRLLRMLIRIGLIPFWTIGQIFAPLLDKLDRNWELEASGYVVTARKP